MLTAEFLITSLVVVLIPGTGVLYTLSTGLFLGVRASCFAAIGCTVGIVPALLASIFGLAALLHTSAMAFQFVKFAGVAYLLFMAWSMWRASDGFGLGEAPTASLLSIASKGFFINILNPKLTLFFLAFLPQFLPASSTTPVLDMSLLGLIFMGMTLAVFLLYGALAHYVSRWLLRSEKVARTMQRGFAASFAALGVKLAMSERA